MKINEVDNEIQEILKKYNYDLGYSFEFPMYKILPDEVKLALSVLEHHGMKVVVSLVEKTD